VGWIQGRWDTADSLAVDVDLLAVAVELLAVVVELFGSSEAGSSPAPSDWPVEGDALIALADPRCGSGTSCEEEEEAAAAASTVGNSGSASCRRRHRHRGGLASRDS
jgi:hypothetical protein